MNIINDILEKSKSSIELFKKALENKSFTEFIKSASMVIKSMVYYTEMISIELKRLDMILSSKDKHDSVKLALQETIITIANDKIDIPFLTEEQERKFVFEPLINIGIKASVSFFNKKGWKLDFIEG